MALLPHISVIMVSLTPDVKSVAVECATEIVDVCPLCGDFYAFRHAKPEHF